MCGGGRAMANLANGLKNLSKGWNAYKVTSKTAGFHRMKMRLKMNKLSNTPVLVGRDEFGNRYYEDTSESFGRNQWVEYRAPNKKVSQSREDGAVHGGTTDHGFDASQVGPQWHGWLHYMTDEKPGTLTGYDGKLPSYTLAHAANQTGRSGSPEPDRYHPPWHRNSRVYTGQHQEKVEAWVPPGSQ